MNPRRWQAAAALILMLIALASASAWRPTRHLADSMPKVDLEGLFPRQFADWKEDRSMPVQLVSPDTQALLDKIYNQTLSRVYLNGRGDRIMLSVAYGGDQSDGTRAHRPEVCYPAQGFQIFADERASLDVSGGRLPVRRLVARQGGRNEPITYWVVIGERIVLSGTQQKLAQLAYTTRGIIPDGVLVRVSTIDTDAPHAFAVQTAFVADLARSLAPTQQRRVFGALGTDASGGGA